jgi:hypothetical protein
MLAACAAQGELDADPHNLQIEIGRYKALMAQVAEYTGVSYIPVVVDAAEAGPQILLNDLKEAVADYNQVREALCASRAGATTYVRIREQSCTARYAPRWGRPAHPSHAFIARRSREAGAPIIGLWGEVCDEARRLEKDPDAMVCPME